jgi:UDP-glucose 4-epimerase
MSNILVTGGAGFVGTNLIKRLISEGHSVVSVDNYKTGSSNNHQDNVEYVFGDIRNKINYEKYGSFDVVFHMAAIARIQPSFINPIEYFEVNANGTLNIVEFCSKKNIPLVYAGSSSHHSGKFKNPYTFSKDIGEEIIQLYQRHYNLKSSIARFYNVYGPHHLKEGGYCTLIGSWEKLIEENKELVIYGDGTKRRDFTHVDDIVDGLSRIYIKEKWGHVFEFGRGKNYSVLDIANMFGKSYRFEDDKIGEAQTTLCDYTIARDLLSWIPKKNIEDYIKNYLSK